MTGLDRTLTIQDGVRSMSEAQGAVLLHLETGRYHSLNGIGARIWSDIAEGRTLAEILQRLGEAYAAPRETLEQDLLRFVRSLEERGLVSVRS